MTLNVPPAAPEPAALPTGPEGSLAPEERAACKAWRRGATSGETLIRPRAASPEDRNRRVTFALDPSALACVEILAERMGRSRSEMLRELLLLGIIELTEARQSRAHKGVWRERARAAQPSQAASEIVVRAIDARRTGLGNLPAEDRRGEA